MPKTPKSKPKTPKSKRKTPRSEPKTPKPEHVSDKAELGDWRILHKLLSDGKVPTLEQVQKAKDRTKYHILKHPELYEPLPYFGKKRSQKRLRRISKSKKLRKSRKQ